MSRWHDDPFTKKAHRENFHARSVYKLEEIDKKEKLVGKAHIIIDLGASPGSWTQYCLKTLPKEGRLIAVDLSPIKVQDPRLEFFQKSIEEVDFRSLLSDKKADLVLSDMAPKTSGIHDRDVALSLELVELATKVAEDTLREGGAFIVKLFMGEGFEEYLERLKKTFKEVKLLRPETTRKHSREIYFIAKNFSP